jgi:hypothetical protein
VTLSLLFREEVMLQPLEPPLEQMQLVLVRKTQVLLCEELRSQHLHGGCVHRYLFP